MDNSIVLGVIIGLTIVMSVYVLKSENFTKVQKTIILLCIVFPPLQWILIAIISLNNSIRNKSTDDYKRTEKYNTKEQSNYIKDSSNKQKEILIEQAYDTKKEVEKNNFKSSLEYKYLKSLFDSGALTKKEYDSRINVLKRDINSNHNSKHNSKQNSTQNSKQNSNTKDNKKKLPYTTAVIILGILSILSCSILTIGIIFGIIGLVLTKSDKELSEEKPQYYTNYNGLGKLLCIIGIILCILYSIVF